MPETTKETLFRNEEKILALQSKFETIDFETGELINVLDSSIPVTNRLDAAKWLIDNFTYQIELCKERKHLWNDREDVFKNAIETIRGTIKGDMQYDGLEKIKTYENTAYLTHKEIPEYDEARLLPEYKVYDLSLKGMDYATYNQVVKFASNMKIPYTSKDQVNPDSVSKELINYIPTTILTIKKSPKSN
jgi:hypothetical protein